MHFTTESRIHSDYTLLLNRLQVSYTNSAVHYMKESDIGSNSIGRQNISVHLHYTNNAKYYTVESDM